MSTFNSFKVEGKQTLFTQAALSVDISQYTCTLSVTTPSNLVGKNASLDNYRMSYLSHHFDGNGYTTVFCPESARRMMNITTRPFVGSGSVATMFTRTGVDFSIQQDSQSSYWCMPAMKLKSVIQEANAYAKYPVEGSAVRFFIAPDGKVHSTDLRRNFKLKPIDYKGTIVSDDGNIDWVINTPGKVTAYTCGPRFQETTWSFKEGYGGGAVNIEDSQGHSAERLETRARNEFWYAYFTARSITATIVATVIPEIGKPFTINGQGPFLCAGYTIPISPTNTANQCTIRGVCPI